MGRRGPKPTTPRNLLIYAMVWRDEDFVSLGFEAQMAAFRSIAQLGIDCSLGGERYGPGDLDMDPSVFATVAPDLVRLGIWTFIDKETVEVWPYKALIVPEERVYRPRIPLDVRNAVLDRDGHACRRCGATERLEMDHIFPFSRGGAGTIDNLQCLCRSCNYRKGARI